MMSPIRMKKLEAALRAAVEFNQAVNEQNLDKLKSLISENCIYETPDASPCGIRISGKVQILSYWEQWFSSHPGWMFEPQEVHGMGSRCMLYWQLKRGEENADSDSEERGIDIISVLSGRITEIRSFMKGRLD